MRKSLRQTLFCVPCRQPLSQADAQSHAATAAHLRAESGWRSSMAIDRAIKAVATSGIVGNMESGV